MFLYPMVTVVFHNFRNEVGIQCLAHQRLNVDGKVVLKCEHVASLIVFIAIFVGLAFASVFGK